MVYAASDDYPLFKAEKLLIKAHNVELTKSYE